VGGLERVYELGKDFRNEGVSFKHNPEFTMLEWYEAYADYSDTMVRIETLVGTVGAGGSRHDGGAVPRPRARAEGTVGAHPVHGRSRVQGALTRDAVELRARLTERGVDTDADRDWAQLVDKAFSHFVEPELIQPTIVYDYPIELSPFARATDDDPLLTERFEYFAGGMELGNAFSEINDAPTQQARFEQQAKQLEGEPGDPDYVEALSYGMPPPVASGSGSTAS